jgi:transcriptional regulator with XRE-family HTH domain
MLSLRQRLGAAIRHLRTKAGYSQEAFGDAVGLHRTYMGSLERGERNVSLDNIEKIARALGLSAGQLILEAERNTWSDDNTGSRSKPARLRAARGGR